MYSHKTQYKTICLYPKEPRVRHFLFKKTTRRDSGRDFASFELRAIAAVSPSVLSRVRPRASVPAVWRGASSVNSPVNSNALEGRASVAREVSGEGKRTKGSRAEGTV